MLAVDLCCSLSKLDGYVLKKIALFLQVRHSGSPSISACSAGIVFCYLMHRWHTHLCSRPCGPAKSLLVQVLLYCRAGVSAVDLCDLAVSSFGIPIEGEFEVHMPQS